MGPFEDFGEVLRHERNYPLTGILGNAELLLAEIRRKRDGRVPSGGEQRLETIATLAVRLRETVRRLSEEWEARKHPRTLKQVEVRKSKRFYAFSHRSLRLCASSFLFFVGLGPDLSAVLFLEVSSHRSQRTKARGAGIPRDESPAPPCGTCWERPKAAWGRALRRKSSACAGRAAPHPFH